MDNLDLAYCAGLFDGEGSITARIGAKKDKEYALIHVSMHQNDPDLLAFFHRTVMMFGSIREYNSPRGNKIWQWQAGGNTGAASLMILLPCLRLKKKQAQIAINIMEGVGGMGTRRSEDLLEKQKALILDFKKAQEDRRNVSYG